MGGRGGGGGRRRPTQVHFLGLLSQHDSSLRHLSQSKRFPGCIHYCGYATFQNVHKNRGDRVNLAINWRAEIVCKKCNDLGDIQQGLEEFGKIQKR